jgi:hypothetical protein
MVITPGHRPRRKRLFHYCRSFVTVETCSFVVLLLSNGRFKVASIGVVAYQAVYMSQYLLSVFLDLSSGLGRGL